MKRTIAVLLLNFLIISAYSQEYGIYKIGESFNSVFQNLEKGEFTGTINGVLFIKDTRDKEVILDFQAGKSELNVLHDSTEMYDVSIKEYLGWTTSGKTKILYSTYADSNKFSVELATGIFKIGSHDGGCDMVVNGINYQYKIEPDAEYLIISFDKDLVLSNLRWLINQDVGLRKANELKKEITVEAHSVLVFVTSRD